MKSAYCTIINCNVGSLDSRRETFSPLGCAILADKLRRSGYRTCLFDCQFEDYGRFGQLLLQNDSLIGCQIFAFSVMHTSVPMAIILARLAKDTLGSRAVTIIGGSGAFGITKELERFECFDLISSDPRPQALLELVSAVGTPTEQPRQLDSVYSWLADEQYDHLTVSASKGCINACSFCSVAAYWGKYEARDVTAIQSDLDWCYSRGHRMLDFIDDTLFVNRRQAMTLLEILSSYRGLRWRCFGRADCMDETLLEEAARAGCAVVYYGMESGSPRILRTLRKGLNVTQAKRTAVASSRIIDRVFLSYMWGYPDETIEEFYQTLLDMQELACLANVVYQLNPVRAYPGTPLHQRYRRQIIFQRDAIRGYYSYYSRFLPPQKATEAIELILRNPDVFCGFGLVPSPELARKQQLIQSLCLPLS